MSCCRIVVRQDVRSVRVASPGPQGPQGPQGPPGPPGEGFGLTDRELAVLRGIVAGKTNPAIAVDLAFSLSTIRNDTTEIFRKLGVTKRRDAAAKAVAVGLVATD